MGEVVSWWEGFFLLNEWCYFEIIPIYEIIKYEEKNSFLKFDIKEFQITHIIHQMHSSSIFSIQILISKESSRPQSKQQK